MTHNSYRGSIAFLAIALGIIFIWFGGIKFTTGGASAIEGLINNSPLLSWVYGPFSVTAFAAILGTIEIIIGLMLIIGISKGSIGKLGALGGIVTFLITLSFMFTTPGVVPEDAAFPVLSGMPGEFLLKDLGLLAISVFLFSAFGAHETTTTTD